MRIMQLCDIEFYLFVELMLISAHVIALLGRKSGKGCYVYQPGLKRKDINPELGDILEHYKMPVNPSV